VDPLADLLDLGRVRGALLAHVVAGSGWGLALPDNRGGASFHAVLSGIAWCSIAGSEPRQLMPGDLLLLPRGAAHRLSSLPGGRCEPFDRAMKQERMRADGQLLLGEGAAQTTFLCAGYDYDAEIVAPLMRLLPDAVHLPADPIAGRATASVLDLLAQEMETHGAGTRSAVSRLIELLLIGAIRRWAQSDEALGTPSWLTALSDPTAATAVSLIHDRPQEPWTLDRLAREANVSRATLVRRFNAAVGEAPLSYLGRWRMHLAAQRLKYTDEPVGSIARSLGYRSEYAFNRAFARERGRPPGRYRRELRADPARAATTARAASGAR
jgi:AraC-like DNA-binding protein